MQGAAKADVRGPFTFAAAFPQPDAARLWTPASWPLLLAAAECGFLQPSETQLRCLPRALAGGSFICQAPPGTGKTVALVLTVLHRLLNAAAAEAGGDCAGGATRALVLCHSRELASFIAWLFHRLTRHWPKQQGHGRRPRIGEFCGGASQRRDAAAAAAGPAVAVGTPGRVLDLTRRGLLRLGGAAQVALDECDHLAQKAATDVRQLVLAAAPGAQVMMFCTTLGAEVLSMCQLLVPDPVVLAALCLDDERRLAPPGLLQYRVPVPAGGTAGRNAKLLRLLDALEFDQLIIFVSSSRQCAALERLLRRRGFPAVSAHGDMPQALRQAVYLGFRSFRSRIMVATDLYSRGLQFDRVDVVINYQLGADPDDYVHRVGRAGRFGGRGLALTLASPDGLEEATLAEVRSRLGGAGIPDLPGAIEAAAYAEGRVGTIELEDEISN